MMHTPSRPGKIIREELIDTLRLSITEAADKLAMSRAALSRVLNCRAAVSVELAQALKKPQRKVELFC